MGEASLDNAMKAYLGDVPTTKGSEVLNNLHKICLTLKEKIENLEATNVTLMAEKALVV